MPNTMNQKYIEDHMLHVHTPESWGRSVAYQVLAEAAKEIGSNDVEATSVTATFHVSPIEALGCIQICAWGVCVHVSV